MCDIVVKMESMSLALVSMGIHVVIVLGCLSIIECFKVVVDEIHCRGGIDLMSLIDNLHVTKINTRFKLLTPNSNFDVI